eukprot:449607_1
MLSRMSYLLALMMLLLCTGALVDAAENKEDESGGVSESASNDDEDYAYRIYAFKAQTNGMLSKFVKKKVELPKPIPSILVNALDEDNAAAFEELSKEQKAAITSSLLNDSNNLILIEAKPESTVKQTEKGPVLIYGFAFGKDDFEGPKVGISDVLQEKFRQKFQTQTSHSFARPAPMRFDSDHVRVFFSNDWKVKIRTDDGFLFPAPVTNVHKLQYEIRLLHKIEGEIEPRAEHLSSYGEFDKWFNGIIDKAAEAQPNPVPNYESNLRYRGFDPREYFNVAKFAPAYWKYSDWKAGDKVTLVVSDHNRNFVAFATVDLSDEDIEDYSVKSVNYLAYDGLVAGYIREHAKKYDFVTPADLTAVVGEFYNNDVIHTKLVWKRMKKKHHNKFVVAYFDIPANLVPDNTDKVEFLEIMPTQEDLSNPKSAEELIDRNMSKGRIYENTSGFRNDEDKPLRVRVTREVFNSWWRDGSTQVTAFFCKTVGMESRVFKYARIDMITSEKVKQKLKERGPLPVVDQKTEPKSQDPKSSVETRSPNQLSILPKVKLVQPEDVSTKQTSSEQKVSDAKADPLGPLKRRQPTLPKKEIPKDQPAKTKLDTHPPKPSLISTEPKTESKTAHALDRRMQLTHQHLMKKDELSVTEDPKDPYTGSGDNTVSEEDIPDDVSNLGVDAGDVEMNKGSSSVGVFMFIIILAVMVGLFVWQKEYILKMFENL